MEVSVELRPEAGKLFAQARFETPAGPLIVDHIFVRVYPDGRPKVMLPARRAGDIYLNLIRLPNSWYSDLRDAVERALAESER